MIVAQALGEYSAGAGEAMLQAVRAARLNVQSQMADWGPVEYCLILLGAVVLWKIMGRR
jgi:hypothetical protein